MKIIVDPIFPFPTDSLTSCTFSILLSQRECCGSRVLHMAVSYMNAAAELGRNPVSKHQIQPEYGDEQADAGRDG